MATTTVPSLDHMLGALQAGELDALIQQLDAKDAATGPLRRTLERSAEVLREHPNQFAAHLIGRLSGEDEPGLTRLVDRAQRWRPHQGVAAPSLGELAGAASSDGALVASCSNDGTARVWRVEDGQPRGRVHVFEVVGAQGAAPPTAGGS